MSEALFVEEGEVGLRLDQLLMQRFSTQYSRTYFQSLIADGLVLLNGEQVKKRVRPKVGDEIEVEFALPREIDLKPEKIPLDILYEDDHLIAINKPASMVVHPAPGHEGGTFVNALLYHVQVELPASDTVRPGIVHRLDKDTTGVLIAAKSVEAHRKLVEAFSRREVEKEYVAIVHGNPREGTLTTCMGRDPKNRQKMAVLEEGKEAITEWKTLQSNDKYSLVSIRLITGRTHQIRVHMHHLKHPIVGDALYGRKGSLAKRQLLHAKKVELHHPITGEKLLLEAPMPEELTEFFSR